MTITDTRSDTVTLPASYLTLNADHPRVQAALIDAHLMHQLIMTGFAHAAFPGETTARANLGVLYAMSPTQNGTVRVRVRATVDANWTELPADLLATGDHTSISQQPEHAPLAGRIAFQLTAAPTKSLPTHRPGARGRRVPLPADQRLDWGMRALTHAGLNVHTLKHSEAVRLESETKSLPRDQRNHPKAVFAHTTVTYTGTATITDPDTHRAALLTGRRLGPGKAFGCGLLLTRRIK